MNDRLTQLAADQAAKLAAQDQAGSFLAEVLLAADRDHLEALETLRPALPEALWIATCESMEVCPVHVCDAAICADDMADCEAGISAVEAYEAREAEEETKKWAAQLLYLQTSHPAAAELVEQGWTVESALSHVEGTCDLELCGHPSHRVCEWFAGCGQPAEMFVAHPVLGQVPSCARCQTVVGR
jgi:hypothetical protein